MKPSNKYKRNSVKKSLNLLRNIKSWRWRNKPMTRRNKEFKNSKFNLTRGKKINCWPKKK